MTKKIKDLTNDEIEKICSENNCKNCPFKFFSVKITNISNIEDNYSVCLSNIRKILESEVVVDDIDKR